MNANDRLITTTLKPEDYTLLAIFGTDSIFNSFYEISYDKKYIILKRSPYGCDIMAGISNDSLIGRDLYDWGFWTCIVSLIGLATTSFFLLDGFTQHKTITTAISFIICIFTFGLLNTIAGKVDKLRQLKHKTEATGKRVVLEVLKRYYLVATLESHANRTEDS